jgi:hypothetical protein
MAGTPARQANHCAPTPARIKLAIIKAIGAAIYAPLLLVSVNRKRFQTDGVWFPKTYTARSIQLAEIAQKLSIRLRPIIPQANAHSFLSIF